MVQQPYTKNMAKSKPNTTDDEGGGATKLLGENENKPVVPAPNDEENPAEAEPTKEECESEGQPVENSETQCTEDSNTAIETLEMLGEDECLDDASHKTSCAICLNDYAEGDMVLRGKTCEHMFHRTCTMEWLYKHDHCPFCRQEMVTPAEFRETAIELLGEGRVKKLSMRGSATNRDNTNDESGEDSIDDAE